MKAKTAMKATVMLLKNKRGKLVSKMRSAHCKNNPWIAAVNAARQRLGIKGFCPAKKESDLYKKAKYAYNQYKIAKQYWHRRGEELDIKIMPTVLAQALNVTFL